ncbi:3-oxoacyl-[acyl-carrier-protein] synthase [Chytridiales sp. JEL 0842]|nr:3-oxoacyl-[acyl-carrier-protein] synthase [Chytridiales sp. JEL 0842]
MPTMYTLSQPRKDLLVNTPASVLAAAADFHLVDGHSSSTSSNQANVNNNNNNNNASAVAAAAAAAAVSAATAAQSRPLPLKSKTTELSIPIPLPLWPTAEQLRDSLQTFLLTKAESPAASGLDPTAPVDEDWTPMELVCFYLKLGLEKINYVVEDRFATPQVLEVMQVLGVVMVWFQDRFLGADEIHVATRDLSDKVSFAASAQDGGVSEIALAAEGDSAPTNGNSNQTTIRLGRRSTVLRTYFSTLTILKRHGLLASTPTPTHPSALLSTIESGRANCLAVFGGQGNLENYFEELSLLLETYPTLALPFLTQAAQTLLTHSSSEEATKARATKVELLAWLEKPETRPSTEKLLETGLSLPLIGLGQLVVYWVNLKVLERDVGSVRDLIAGTTGHSQGIVSSVVLSTSSTDAEFVENTQKALGLLFWIGLRAQSACPTTTINPNILQDSLENNEGVPTPMLLVSGLRYSEVTAHAQSTNAHLPPDRHVHLSLINGPRACIFTGPPQSLYGLNLALRKLKAQPGVDQSRVPHSQRKVRFTSRFLPVAVPFHSSYLASVPALVQKDMERLKISFELDRLKVPVWSTNTGQDLRTLGNKEGGLVGELVDLICVKPVHWEKATQMEVTHILDFGPGGASGVGGLTHRNKEGRGVQVILASTLDANLSIEMLDKSFLFSRSLDSVRFAPNWAEKYKPKLIRIASTNQIHVDTSFSRLLGKPPLMVAGMTPCTASEEFVAAITNAGFHVELAGGGQHTEKHLRDRIEGVIKRVGPGEGVSLNILFLNPRLWGFQYPQVMSMRKEGIPMEGICVAAGVPSLDVANEVVRNLKEAGIKHVAFKPGSVETIRRVVSIAKANEGMNIILQWTGGRGGGHHSFEDFHGPMLETYGAIRRCPNIILVVGSGFGDSEGTIPYLTGEWSTQFDYAPMPFDGLLFGSRVMIAKECLTSAAVKKLIAEAPGIADESQWERTYKGVTGGIITVKSELGEPIHKIANRGVMFWREMDDLIFSLPKEKRLPVLLKRKDEIIAKMNADFQKPWFGRKQDGRVCDLHEMTYKEVSDRLLELLYVKHQSRWIDPTLRDTVADFLRRVEERFTKTPGSASLLQSSTDLDMDPASFLQGFFDAFPEASEQILTQEDAFHFLAISSYPWRKPVPFIPVLDDKFEFWLKKDSLWQSEDVDAVVDQDAGRVAILQGPVAVRHSKVVDEPVGEILGGIYKGHIEALKEKYYGNSDLAIPVVEYLGARPSHSLSKVKGVQKTELFDSDKSVTLMYEVTRNPTEVPATQDFLELLSGGEQTWLRALLTTESIVRGKMLVPNPVQVLCKPRVGQTVFLKLDSSRRPQVLSFYSGRTSGSVPSRHAALIVSMEGETVTVTINEKKDGEFVPLVFYFKYRPWQGYAMIHEVMEGRNQRIKDFYAALWNVDPKDSNLKPTDTFRSTFHVTAEHIRNFTSVVSNQAELYHKADDAHLVAPMDFGIVAGWRSIVNAILPKEIDGDLLKLVHLSNEFRVLSDDMITAGDVIETRASVNAVIISESGKTVEVKATLFKGTDKPVLEIISSFLYRGKFTDYENTLRNADELPVEVNLKSVKDVAVLQSKKWIQWNADAPELTPGSVLIFRLQTFTRSKSATSFSEVQTTGSVFLRTTKETVQVGKVEYHAKDCFGNVVTEYLHRNGSPIEQDIFFSNGGYSILPDPKVFPSTVDVPVGNEMYAKVSNDLNPIHVNPYFADLANLPGTITHGMWTSAATRKFVEIFAANNQPQRVKEYKATFMGMVLPGDQLETKLSHVGMSNGKKLIKITTLNQRGEKVLEGSAEVEQPTTSYVFTGQGSQEVGMGMDLYEKSPVAKEIWDRADSHMQKIYGVSILEIVRDNPVSKTIHFGGLKGGMIRKHYQAMTYDVIENGKLKSLPLFPDIKDDTPSYTFSHLTGLLSATQFTQPALTLMEIANFQDMKANGLVQQDCPFAGHSLGEYAGLAAVGQVLPIESLVDVVFYRGMTMQVAVPRDAAGRSDYGMVAINPIRVTSTFNEQALRFVISSIARRTNRLLEIVNFNVENVQYVAAGELVNLDILRLVLNKIKSLNVNFAELVRTKTLAEIEELLDGLVDEAATVAEARKAATGYIVPERGVATIPLAGIDVPFHSSFLLNGVTPFREILRKKIEARFLNVSLLIGKYIPNLTAIPFSLEKDYFEMVYDLTKSAWIKQVLAEWDATANATPAGQQQLGYILLIELLAHQFASPVRWIETQDLLFKDFEVERLIEVGPGPVLSGMAIRTLKIKYEAYDDAVTRSRVQLCTSKDRKDIYYEFEDAVVEAEAAPAVSVAAPASVVAAAPVAVSAPVAQAAGPVADEPVTAQEVLIVLIAQKLKKSIPDVPLSKSIKDLVGGKSTLQNEILGDLAAEFGNVLQDKAEENSLAEVGGAIQNAFSGNLGKTSMGLINKLVSAKMPAGFSMNAIKAYLNATYGLGPKRSEAVLLHGLTAEPAGRLGSEAEAKSWLDNTAKAYAAKVGISLGGASSAAAGGAAAGGAVVTVNSEEFNLQKLKLDVLIRTQLDQFAKYLDIDLLESARVASNEKESSVALQNELDVWSAEHGDVYADGIRPVFTTLKARVFDSHWNWARQDALHLYYDFVFGRITNVDRDLMNQCIQLMNRAEDYEALIEFMEYYLTNTPKEKGENYERVQSLGKVLLDNCKEALKADPVYKNIAYRPTMPKTYVSAKGELVYKEERRAASNLKDYVKEIEAGSHLTRTERPSLKPLADKFNELNALLASGKMDAAQKTEIDNIFKQIKALIPQDETKTESDNMPFVFLKKRRDDDPAMWEYDPKLTGSYFNCLRSMATDGITFKDKHALITGCGKDSIGVEILKALLAGGARVIVTTSRFSKSVTEYYRSIYERHGSKGSRLVVVPFNGGSLQDTKALINYIYDKDPKNGLNWDLDFVIPFAAIPENGRELDGIDGKSELAHRIMLTNLLRLLGEIKMKKQQLGYDTRPASVLLPMSPNHGTFGGDGLYGESKIALETLLNRFHAESWSSYLTIIGAAIGWTRGTGLMSGNNIVAEGIESLGARTFSTVEMAFVLVGLLHPSIVKLSYTEPVWADLNGGLHFVKDLKHFTANLRKELMETSEVRKAVSHEAALDEKVLRGPVKQETVTVTPRANMKFAFPTMPQTQKLTHLRGALDLEKTVVITGFGEVGPWGSTRTRWEMEAYGEFSLEGCIEMAWIMGFVKFHNGPLKKMPFYSGWIDVETQEPVKDFDIKAKYEKKILEHSGIRLIEPALFQGYDPNKKMFLQEMVVTTDMAPIEVSEEEAEAFKRQHGDRAVVEQRNGSFYVYIKKGATLFVPKALRFDRLVAGQIPTGWNASRYGIPDDIVAQVDPITLYTLVATVEALITSGITDPYEFYQYVHVSEVGNTSGGGMGGMRAMQGLFKERLMDKPVQKDILQESFINTMPAWVNMLLLSSSGPIKTPVGACATAAESVEIGYETILSGKARIVICGGYDDFQEEGSYEFANMKATSNSIEEFARGREPRDMCRPASDTRAGFMESQGAGIHILMTADLAVKMGVPIRAIVACTNTATDKNGRSVPAPGQGILTTAREAPTKFKSPLLSFEYRMKQLKREREHVKSWVAKEYEALGDEVEELKKSGADDIEEFVKERTDFIEKEGKRKEKTAIATWNHDWWKNDPTISPIKGSLACYGLTVDDLGVASFHGTGTKANDYNESSALNQQMAHLGRSKGNVLPSIFQKHLTGHPKGAAAAWMLNGVLQVLETGIIPGNRNLDNVEDRLSKFRYILYPSRSVQTDGVRAGILKSFGFGQAGGEIVVVHPDYLYAALEEADYLSYKTRREARQTASYRYFHETLTGAGSFVRVKSAAPYTDAQQSSVYLNPLARASFDPSSGSWAFTNAGVKNTKTKQEPTELEVSQALVQAAAQIPGKGVGVDVQLVSEVNVENEVFVERNFTKQEVEYCRGSASPSSSFAGRWAAKEAVIKAVSAAAPAGSPPLWTRGAGAPLQDIEILREDGKAPVVVFHGAAQHILKKAGVKEVKVTISHSGSYAVAMAVAN